MRGLISLNRGRNLVVKVSWRYCSAISVRWQRDFPHGAGKSDIRLTLTLTHEEIAQMIGSSLETVTWLFSDFKKKQLLQIKGSTLITTNKAGLENVLGS